jgi:hypothetical protein
MLVCTTKIASFNCNLDELIYKKRLPSFQLRELTMSLRLARLTFPSNATINTKRVWQSTVQPEMSQLLYPEGSAPSVGEGRGCNWHIHTAGARSGEEEGFSIQNPRDSWDSPSGDAQFLRHAARPSTGNMHQNH